MIMFLVLMAQAVAAEPSSKSANQPGDIVVTARSTAQTERALAACLARHCPPKEDIAASVAQAENQLVAGDYYGARKTLLAARGRDERFAGELPVEVAGLLRANARLAGFTGSPDTARINQIDSLDALKRGLPAGDAQILVQRLEIGDAFAKQGELQSAIDVYRNAEREAHKRGIKSIEGLAMLRQAVLYGGVASVIPSYGSLAASARKRLEHTTDPELQPFRDAIGDLAVRLRGRAAATAPAVIPANAETISPRLIYQPAVDPNQLRAASISARVGDGAFIQWADVAFRIGPSGTVKDIEVLRHSMPFDARWLDAATSVLRGRRYSGYPATANPPGIDRIERYSFVYDTTTSEFDPGSGQGTRIPVRSRTGRIDTLDMTPPFTARFSVAPPPSRHG